MLAKIEVVENPVASGSVIRFAIDGGDREQISILHALADARVEVLEYIAHDESLEDVFLQVTEGRVQ